MSIGRREDELYNTFQAIIDAELPHVCVGGLAVSAFMPRTTLDIDIVTPATSHDMYHPLLEDHGYEFRKEYEIEGVYRSRMVQYQKAIDDYTVEVELLLGALGCRQTGAEWGYDYFEQHSVEQTIRGTTPENELTTRIAEPELLVAVKLHSGRSQDARDAVAVAVKSDLEQVAIHLTRGDADALNESIGRVLAEIQREQFDDSFKGVFSLQSMPDEHVDEFIAFLERQRDSN